MNNSSITVTKARHAWTEQNNFVLERPHGYSEHTFFHFSNPVEILVQNEIITAPADSCIFYTAGMPQWFRSQGALTHDWMFLSGDLTGCLSPKGLLSNTLYLCRSGKEITRLLLEMEQEARSSEAYAEEMLSLLFQELLIRLTRSSIRQECSPPPIEAAASLDIRMKALRDRMFSQLGHAWSIAELADIAGLSKSHFTAVYNKMFQSSPIDDLIQARIDTAQKRLVDTNISVSNLAENLGYQNVTHFCRQFKQVCSMSPAQYRKENQDNQEK